ncbi:MAG: carbon storage regulator, CsrA [Firmicutes bacterium]|nr:carbon storage regulator, CsrA [Bacillota bacterium]
MLVLTRRENEGIQLGDEIKITILGIEADRVKIGIDAPRSMKIMRAEILAEVKAVNAEATQATLAFMNALSPETGVQLSTELAEKKLLIQPDSDLSLSTTDRNK